MAESANYGSLGDVTEGVKQSYTTSAGTDILVTIDGILLGNLNGISFSTTREKAPVYVMGSVDAVSFGRGKRGHAGSLVFTNFDRHALSDIMDGFVFDGSNADAKKRYHYWKKATDVPAGGRSTLLDASSSFNIDQIGIEKASANYSDQLPPFTITLTSATEYGRISVMHLLGVELINEGSGVSIDDIVAETQMTFVARAIIGWRPIVVTGDSGNASNTDILSRINKLAAVRQVEAFQAIDNA